MMVSIVIPCKDEPYLDWLVDSIHCSLQSPHEILIQTEPGLGLAAMRGIKKAKGDIIAVLDADGSHNPGYLAKMVNLTWKFPLVLGSRYTRGGVSKDFAVRQFLSRVFCGIARALLKLDIQDPMSGFVVAKRQVFEKVSMKPIGYKFPLELLVKSNGCFGILEYPIVFQKRKMGSSKTGVNEGIKTLAFILMLWFWKTSHRQ